MKNADAVRLPQSWLRKDHPEIKKRFINDVAEAAAALARRAWTLKENTSILFNGTLLTASYNESESETLCATRAVMWWHYDIGLEREKSWESQVARLREALGNGGENGGENGEE